MLVGVDMCTSMVGRMNTEIGGDHWMSLPLINGLIIAYTYITQPYATADCNVCQLRPIRRDQK